MEFVLGGAVALAAVVVLVVLTRDSNPPKAREGAAAEEPVRDMPRLAEAPVEAGRSAIETNNAVTGHTVRPAPCPAGSFLLEVVDERARPLAGIPVLLLALDRAASEDPYRRRGAALRKTDSDGQAFFSLELHRDVHQRAELEGVQVMQRLSLSPELEGSPQVELPGSVEDGQRFRLVLPEEIARLYRPLRVRVVDRKGAPVGGVPVDWIAWPVDQPRAIVHGGTGRTRSEDGIAELSLEVLRELTWKQQHAGGEHHYRAEISLPFVGGSPAEELKDPAKEALVTLVLPDTGSVEARVSLANGTPVGEGARVRAWGWAPEDAADDVFLGEAPVVDGRATLDFVGLDLDLRITASPEDHSRAAGWLELPGPRRAGERVEARLQLGPEATRLRFEAVDELGAPLSGAKLTGTLEARELGNERGTQFSFEATADERGAATFRVDGLPAGSRVLLRLETRFVSAVKATHRLRSELELPSLQLEHENDLGVIVLHGPPPSHPGVVLVSGSVLDDASEAPLARAHVSVSAGEPGGQQTWIQNVTAGLDGGFEVRGPPGLEGLRLVCFAREHESGGCTFEQGASVVLRLQGEKPLLVRVLLDPELPRYRFHFILISEDGTEHVGEAVAPENIRFRVAPPGLYALEVRYWDAPWVIERLEEIRLDNPSAPWAVQIDARLDPLDLRGRVAFSSCILLGPEGHPLVKEIVRVTIDPWGEKPVSTDEDGRLILVAPLGSTAQLEVEGFVPLVARTDSLGQALQLARR